MKGKIECENCNVLLCFNKKDVLKEERIEEDINISATANDIVFVKSGWFIFRKCISIFGTHYDVNKKETTFIICPFCSEKNILNEKIIKKISSRRVVDKRRLW